MSFVLDTNVVSELRRAKSGRAAANVVRWARGVSAASLYLSVVTILELELGVLLAERRDPPQGAALRRWLDDQVLPAFQGRVLDIDTEVARRAASYHVPDPKSDRDALIAAAASTHGMTVVTRNVADFAATGVPVVDPWQEQEPG